MTITDSDARTILNDFFEKAPVLSDFTEEQLSQIVPEGENKDFYRGMISSLLLVHGVLEGATIDTLHRFLPAVKLVTARAANYIVD